jgi:hypothetical protein
MHTSRTVTSHMDFTIACRHTFMSFFLFFFKNGARAKDMLIFARISLFGVSVSCCISPWTEVLDMVRRYDEHAHFKCLLHTLLKSNFTLH